MYKKQGRSRHTFYSKSRDTVTLHFPFKKLFVHGISTPVWKRCWGGQYFGRRRHSFVLYICKYFVEIQLEAGPTSPCTSNKKRQKTNFVLYFTKVVFGLSFKYQNFPSSVVLPHVVNKTKWRRFAHSDCGELFEEYTDIYINPGQTLRLIPPSKKWTPPPSPHPGPNMVDTMIIYMARYLAHVTLSACLVGRLPVTSLKRF
jgi:hypothetical protein